MKQDARDGTFWKVTNPTFGTGVSIGNPTAFSATAAMLVLYNAAADPNLNKLIIPEYLRLIVTNVPGSASSFDLAAVLDSINRYSSGGGEITSAIVNAQSKSHSKPKVARAYFGAITSAAASAAKNIARARVRSAIPVAGDEYLIAFGLGKHDFNTLNGAAAQRNTVDLGPVAIGAGESLVLHPWFPSAADAIEFEYELAFREVERANG